MLVFRCTKKLLARLKRAPGEPAQRSSTILGDWYANVFVVARRPLVLFASEKTLLPVVVTLAESATLVPRFRAALLDVLASLGISHAVAEAEADVAGDYAFGSTASRHVLGVMNEYVFQAKVAFEYRGPMPLHELSLRLGDVLVGSSRREYVVPLEETRKALGCSNWRFRVGAPESDEHGTTLD